MTQKHKYTTVKIPKDLWRILRVYAAERDQSLQTVIERLVSKGLQHSLKNKKQENHTCKTLSSVISTSSAARIPA
jgi:hypothetical protein